MSRSNQYDDVFRTVLFVAIIVVVLTFTLRNWFISLPVILVVGGLFVWRVVYVRQQHLSTSSSEVGPVLDRDPAEMTGAIADMHRVQTELRDGFPEFARAAVLVVGSQLGSASMLQRKMRISFVRAGQIMELLEAQKVVGPQHGSAAREVLIDPPSLPVLSSLFDNCG